MAECCNHFSFTDDGDSFESWQGLRGPYYIPHISADGVLSWTNTGSLPNPAPMDISGPPGSSVELRGPVPSVEDLPDTAPSGELWLVGSASPYDGWFYNGTAWADAGQIAVGPVGPAGEDGVSPEISVTDITGGHRVTITDADHPQGQQFDVLDGTDGAPGSPGAPGADGVSPEISVTDITGGHRITITDAGGTETFDVLDGTDGQPGQPGTPGADGVSPEVTIAQISGGHSVTITDADHPQGQQFDVLDGTDGQPGQTGPAGPGVPPGGTAGQVLAKTGPSDYSTGWQNPSGGDVTADMLGIVIDGNSTPVGASSGQYVIVKNSTISGATDGLYTAAQEIPANTAIDSTYLTAVSGGGLNSLGSGLSSLYTKLGKFGKTLWSGNFSGSGRISVPGIGGYALVGYIPAAGSGSYTLIGSPWRGGLLFGAYNSAGVNHFAYRFNFVDSNTIEVNANDRGITDGTNTTYSGNADCKITKIVGLIPNSD